MSEDIVVRLRGHEPLVNHEISGMFLTEAADTIEALRGEVDLIATLGVGAALETVAQKERAQKAEAEAVRLKVALEAIASNADEATDLPLFRVQVRDFARQATKETT